MKVCIRNDTFHRLEQRSRDSHLDLPSRMSAALQVIHSWNIPFENPIEGRYENPFEMQKEKQFKDLLLLYVMFLMIWLSVLFICLQKKNRLIA